MRGWDGTSGETPVSATCLPSYDFFLSIAVRLLQAQHFFDGGGDFLHVVHGHVSHVGDAECLFLQIAIAVGDLDAFFGQLLVQLRDIDAPGVLDGGQCGAQVSLIGEQSEVLLRPSADILGHLQVAGIALLQGLHFQHVSQFFLQGEHMAQAGGGRILVLVVFHHFVVDLDDIQVQAAVGNGLGALIGFLGDRSCAHSRRAAQALLGGSDAEVNAQLVHRDAGAAHRGDGVHAEHHVGVFLHHFGDLFDGVHDADGSLVVGHGDQVILAGGQSGIHFLGIGGMAIFRAELVGGHAVGNGHLIPSVAKSADGEHGGALRCAAADGAFHQAGARCGGKDDHIVCLEDLLQLGADILAQLRGSLAAVGDHGGGHLGQHFGAHVYRAGDKELLVHIYSSCIIIIENTAFPLPDA